VAVAARVRPQAPLKVNGHSYRLDYELTGDVVSIAFDTPAYTGEQVPAELLPLLVSPEWVEERKVRWGVTSPIYQSKVLGEFPDVSDDTLILPKWIEAAQKRTSNATAAPGWSGTSPASVRTRPSECAGKAAGSGCTARITRPTP
jgi:hypothetical protein